MGQCPDCGKFRYVDRVSAKRAAKDLHPHDSMRAYQCGQYWHFGHNRK